MRATPPPPWRLLGEAVVAAVGPRPELRGLLPEGIRPLPGPALVVGASYQDTPVGPYLELGLALPARLGLRPGWCVVVQIVSGPEARSGHRQAWGLPAAEGRLSWSVEGDERVLRCERPALELRARSAGPAVPVVVPVRSVQRRSDGPVVVPRRVAGLARLARCRLDVEAGETLGFEALSGPHRGLVLAGVRLVSRPARQPAGLLSSLRAPIRALEPALAAEPPVTVATVRALSSAG